MKFTNRAIRALQTTGKRYEVSETNGHGLRLRVSPTGTKTFVYVFRRRGKFNRLTLGAVGDITLNDAHATHAELRNRVRVGESIVALKAFIGSGRSTGDLTVADLANEWMQRRVRLERKTWRNVERMLKKDVIPSRKDEIDRNTRVWHIPAGHAKNGKTHDVPLSKLALTLLGQLLVLAGDSDYLLPSPTVKNAPIRAEALTRCMTRNRAHFGLMAFNVHDLRRTAASHMTALGVPRLHVSKVLNHSGRDITAIYDRHDYFNEKRDALDLWAANVNAIIKKEN